MKRRVLYLLGFLFLLPAGVQAQLPTEPTAITGPPTSVTLTTATFTATVNPNGARTYCYFEYGTTALYGSNTDTVIVESGSTDVLVSADLIRLRPYDLYHYRIRAQNGYGTSFGEDVSFIAEIPRITVISPDVGEQYEPGETVPIVWRSKGAVGSTVSIELYQGELLTQIISQDIEDTGIFYWEIPSDQPAGFGFRIKIRSSTDHAVYDYSDDYFPIAPANAGISLLEGVVVDGFSGARIGDAIVRISQVEIQTDSGRYSLQVLPGTYSISATAPGYTLVSQSIEIPELDTIRQDFQLSFVSGDTIASDLWIRAVIDSEEKGPMEAVWQMGGEDTTGAEDRVIWGYYHANPNDVDWGSQDNPDLFVKIWFDHTGRLDVNFFHVSVPDIEVYSDYPYDTESDVHGTTTVSRRYIRQYYEEDERGRSSEQNEDGNPPAGDMVAGNPSGWSIANDLSIGAIIDTVEKGPVEALWQLGGQDSTDRGDEVVWGHFYVSPSDVDWGSQNNPDLFVKIWFDAGGRVDVNFFHVSVPDIEVYSAFPSGDGYDQMGTSTMDNRYIRHEYGR